MTPAFTVAPASPLDLPSVATVSRLAFKDNPDTITYWIEPRDKEDIVYECRLRRITKLFNDDPNCYLVNCIETATEKVVAFALWQKPHPKETETVKDTENKDVDEDYPEGTNVALKHDFDEATRLARLRYVDVEKDYSKLKSSC